MPKYWRKQIFAHGRFPEVGQKQKTERKRKEKKRKYSRDYGLVFCIYLLVMPKYWGKQIFTHRRFPKVGQTQKTERKREEEKKERLNDGDNNGQAMHGARKHAWRTQAAWAKRKKD